MKKLAFTLPLLLILLVTSSQIFTTDLAKQRTAIGFVIFTIAQTVWFGALALIVFGGKSRAVGDYLSGRIGKMECAGAKTHARRCIGEAVFNRLAARWRKRVLMRKELRWRKKLLRRSRARKSPSRLHNRVLTGWKARLLNLTVFARPSAARKRLFVSRIDELSRRRKVALAELLRKQALWSCYALASGASLAAFLFSYSWLRYGLDIYYGLTHRSFLSWASGSLLYSLCSAVIAFLFIMFIYTRVKGREHSKKLVRTAFGNALMLSFALVAAASLPAKLSRYAYGDNISPLRAESRERASEGLAFTQSFSQDGITLYEVNYSRTTARMNASADLLTNRIVLSDTMLRSLTPQQLLFVVAHEIGHLADPALILIPTRLVFGSVAFILLFTLGRRAIAKYPQLGINGLTDPAAIPLGALVVSGFLFLQTPVDNYLGRVMEARADRYAVQKVAPDPLSREAACEALRMGDESNLVDRQPHALIKIFMYDHPPFDERKAAILSY